MKYDNWKATPNLPKNLGDPPEAPEPEFDGPPDAIPPVKPPVRRSYEWIKNQKRLKDALGHLNGYDPISVEDKTSIEITKDRLHIRLIKNRAQL